MKPPARVESEDLERRELHLTLFTCAAILILVGGLLILMYPAVFSESASSVTRTPRIAFFGFCGLAILLVAHILDRHVTIMKLRRQILDDRKKVSAVREQASAELLRTLPNFSSFQDRLPMEFRRAASSSQELSILVIRIELHRDFSGPDTAKSEFGDAVKAIARKLREEDSIYLLQMYYLALVLPGTKKSTAQVLSGRISEGLTDVAGAVERFSFTINLINYPENASTAHELEGAVSALLPDEFARQKMQAALVT